jgi:transketolase
VLPGTDRLAREGVGRGAYILAEAEGGKPALILIGTGSEVQHCVGARTLLAREGIQARVVSMPSWELFETQPVAYREQVFPPDVRARLAVEAGVAQGWERYVGPAGGTVSLDHYGASAPIQALLKEFGFTAENVAAQARHLIGVNSRASP